MAAADDERSSTGCGDGVAPQAGLGGDGGAGRSAGLGGDVAAAGARPSRTVHRRRPVAALVSRPDLGVASADRNAVARWVADFRW